MLEAAGSHLGKMPDDAPCGAPDSLTMGLQVLHAGTPYFSQNFGAQSANLSRQ